VSEGSKNNCENVCEERHFTFAHANDEIIQASSCVFESYFEFHLRSDAIKISKMLTDRTIGEHSQTIRASQISPNTRKHSEHATNLVCMVEFNSNGKKIVQELVLPLIIRKAPKQAKMESKACLQKLMQRKSTLHTATSELKSPLLCMARGTQLLSRLYAKTTIMRLRGAQSKQQHKKSMS
jgi:hypothetical protein